MDWTNLPNSNSNSVIIKIPNNGILTLIIYGKAWIRLVHKPNKLTWLFQK